jgi:electron transfer flavoprotein alpha subunit
VVAPADARGKSVIPRAASLIDVGALTDVSSVVSEDTFTRPIYAGNAIATVQSSDKVKLMTVRQTSFAKADAKVGWWWWCSCCRFGGN